MQVAKSRIFLMAVSLLIAFLLPIEVLAEDGRLPTNNQSVHAQTAEEHFRKGHRFYLDSEAEQAEAEFQKALQLDPQLSDAHYYLGSIYFKQENYQAAKEQCQQALAINPEDLNSLIILGLAWQQLGQKSQAIDAFEQALKIDPQSAAAHSALGLAWCAAGDLARARHEQVILKSLDSDLAEDLLQKIEEGNIDID